MKTKTLVLALTLMVLIVAASITYVLGHPSSGGSYYGVTGSSFEDEVWWNDMRAYMEDHWDGLEDEEWWGEMRAYMEDRWADIESEDGWNEMRQYMDERWTESDNGNYSYGRYGGYGGYGRCSRMRW